MAAKAVVPTTNTPAGYLLPVRNMRGTTDETGCVCYYIFSLAGPLVREADDLIAGFELTDARSCSFDNAV